MSFRWKKKINGSVIHIVPEGQEAALCGDQPWYTGIWLDPPTPDLLQKCPGCLKVARESPTGPSQPPENPPV